MPPAPPKPWYDPEVVRLLLRRGLFRKLFNYLTVNRQLRDQSPRMRGYPYYIYLDPSSRCTLKCPHCAVGTRNYPKPMADMDFAAFERLMAEIGPTALVTELYVKGEPLMHKRLHDMVALCKKYRNVTIISSNMQFMDKAAAERLVAAGLDFLKASIDGVAQESYEKYRINGDAGRAFDGIRHVIEARKRLGRTNPFLQWKFIVFRHNEHEIDAARKFAKELGVDDFELCAAGVGPTPLSPEQEAWLPKDPALRMYALDGDKVVKSFYLDAGSPDPCNLPWTSVTFDSQLNVQTCCRPIAPQNDHGRFEKDFFSAIWNNRRFTDSRNCVRNGYKDDAAEKDNMCNGCTAGNSHNAGLPLDLMRKYL